MPMPFASLAPAVDSPAVPAAPAPAPARGQDPPPPWPLPRKTLAFALALIAFGWWERVAWVTHRHAADVPPEAVPLVLSTMPIAFAGRFALVVAEVAAWKLVWAACGRRLPFWRFAAWTVLLSSFDLVSSWLMRLAEAVGGQAPGLLAPVAGLALAREMWPEVSPGLWAGFGMLGVLTVARIVAASRVQAALLGVRPRVTLVAVASAWVVVRTLLWWTADLVRGRSPL